MRDGQAGPGPISILAPHRAGATPGSCARARTLGWVLAGGLVCLLAAGGVARAAEASVPRGDAAARLPQGPLAGEFWDVVARFESGHLLMATIALTNTGLGGRTAVAVGQWVEPDGTAHPFSRSERPGGWRLDASGRRLELGSIVLDQAGSGRRFSVDKNELGIELAIAAAGGAPAVRSDPRSLPAGGGTPGCGFDVLEIAGPATGSFRVEGRGAPMALRGLAAVTHRWMPGLEAECLRRGIELFAMQGGLGLYLRETESPTGQRRSWLLVQRDGALLGAGPPSESTIAWRPGLPGYSGPAELRFSAPGLGGRVHFGETLGTFEPLGRLPAPLRVAMELRTRPRLAWSAPRFELEIGEASPRAIRGTALAKLAWTNPAAGGK